MIRKTGRGSQGLTHTGQRCQPRRHCNSRARAMPPSRRALRYVVRSALRRRAAHTQSFTGK
eukprot:6212852-Pleurochrysis_carterae.AAC.2